MKSTYPWPSMTSASATELNFIIKFFKANNLLRNKRKFKFNAVQFLSYLHDFFYKSLYFFKKNKKVNTIKRTKFH